MKMKTFEIVKTFPACLGFESWKGMLGGQGNKNFFYEKLSQIILFYGLFQDNESFIGFLDMEITKLYKKENYTKSFS